MAAFAQAAADNWAVLATLAARGSGSIYQLTMNSTFRLVDFDKNLEYCVETTEGLSFTKDVVYVLLISALSEGRF